MSAHSLLFALVLIVFMQSVEAQDRGMNFYREVLKTGQICRAGKSGTDVISCFTRASPKKCESSVFQASTREDDARVAAESAWVFCVASCVDAGVWASNFGECRRDLK
jgi:hypothetical protein